MKTRTSSGSRIDQDTELLRQAREKHQSFKFLARIFVIRKELLEPIWHLRCILSYEGAERGGLKVFTHMPRR